MNGIIIVVVILVVIIGLYISSYYFNSKVDKPLGVAEVNCEGCHAMHCNLRNKDGFKDPEQCEIEQRH